MMCWLRLGHAPICKYDMRTTQWTHRGYYCLHCDRALPYAATKSRLYRATGYMRGLRTSEEPRWGSPMIHPYTGKPG